MTTARRARRVAIAFSDTGGGHRSAATAIARAIAHRYGDEIHVDLTDLFTRHARYPFRRLPDWYPAMVGPGLPLWRAGFALADRPWAIRCLNRALAPWLEPAASRFLRDSAPDLVVSVHPLLTAPLVRAAGTHTPVVTVVTDLAAPHAWWFDPGATVTFVPLDAAVARAVEGGVPDSRVRVAGIPIDARFGAPADRAALRRALDWPLDDPVVTLVGGGDGMGPILEYAEAIAGAGVPCHLAIVAGRNQRLRDRLREIRWPLPVHVYEFVSNLPDIVRASDVVVTKAGPGTIAECLAAGVPLVLFHFIAGQETENVAYVERAGAGRWAPTARDAARIVGQWLADPTLRDAVALRARAAAAPDAADTIAQWIGQTLVAM